MSKLDFRHVYYSYSDMTQQSQKSTKGSDETDRRYFRKSELVVSF